MNISFINRRKKELSLTNDDISSASGIPIGTLAKITSGVTKDPKLETLKALASVLKCSLDDFNTEQNKSLEEFHHPLSSPEKKLLTTFRSLSFEKQSQIFDFISFVSSKSSPYFDLSTDDRNSKF